MGNKYPVRATPSAAEDLRIGAVEVPGGNRAHNHDQDGRADGPSQSERFQFEQFDGELAVVSPDNVYVSDCYVADGAGIVVTVETKSYGGILTAMVGVDSEGAVTGVQVTAHSDTSGLGTKAHAASYLEQYIGVTELAGAASIKDDASVSAVTGATVSSNALYQAVYAALQQYQIVQGGAN